MRQAEWLHMPEWDWLKSWDTLREEEPPLGWLKEWLLDESWLDDPDLPDLLTKASRRLKEQERVSDFFHDLAYRLFVFLKYDTGQYLHFVFLKYDTRQYLREAAEESFMAHAEEFLREYEKQYRQEQPGFHMPALFDDE